MRSSQKQLMPQSKNNATLWKYAGMGIQMVATILLFMWLGNRLDKAMNLEKNWFTLLAGLLAVIGILVKLIKNMSS